jgi:hypothetical protein
MLLVIFEGKNSFNDFISFSLIKIECASSIFNLGKDMLTDVITMIIKKKSFFLNNRLIKECVVLVEINIKNKIPTKKISM